MELVLVERRFEQPIDFQDIQLREIAASWCHDTYNVRFLKTFFSRDRRRMLCLYEAPDAEAVRAAEEQAKIPFERAWTCQNLRGDDLPMHAAAKEYVVVERSYPAPITPEYLSSAFGKARSCFEIHRTSYQESFLSRDGLTMVCVFRAPDAEAVRTANDQIQAPYTDVWTASVHLP